MSNQVTSSHIQLTVYCRDCEYEWDIEDYDSTNMIDALAKAEDAPCPMCNAE